MDEAQIRKAWCQLDRLFGPDYPGRDLELKNAAQIYATAVLDADDNRRIEKIGKRHLQLVAEKMLDGKQFSLFLTHVIQFERFLHN